MWCNKNLSISYDLIEVLGSPIGSDDFVGAVCNKKNQAISVSLEKLATMVSLFPQHAFRVFSQSMKFKINYSMRTTSSSHLYASCYETRVQKFIHVLFGSHLNQDIAA